MEEVIVDPKSNHLIKTELEKLSDTELLTLYCISKFDNDYLPYKNLIEMINSIDPDISINTKEIYALLDSLNYKRLVIGIPDTEECSLEVPHKIGIILGGIIRRKYKQKGIRK